MPKTNVTLQKTAAPSRSAASMRPPSPCSALGSENLNRLKLFVIVLSVGKRFQGKGDRLKQSPESMAPKRAGGSAANGKARVSKTPRAENGAQARSETAKAQTPQPSILSFFAEVPTSPAVRRRSSDTGSCSHDVVYVSDEPLASTHSALFPVSTQGGSCKAAVGTPGARGPTGEAGGSRDAAIDLDSDCDERGAETKLRTCDVTMQIQDDQVRRSVNASASRLLQADYDPEADACWRRGERVPFLHLSRTFSVIDNEKGRYLLRRAVSNMFRSILRLSPDDTLPAVYLATGRIAPAHQGIELNVGGAAVCDAIAEVTGVSKAKISAAYAHLGGRRHSLAPHVNANDHWNLCVCARAFVISVACAHTRKCARFRESIDGMARNHFWRERASGFKSTNKSLSLRLTEVNEPTLDLGDVAQSFRRQQPLLLQPQPLLVSSVHKTLLEMAGESGQGSCARRKAHMTRLLRACREHETRYLVRTLVQNMRIGMNTTLVLGALAAAYVLEQCCCSLDAASPLGSTVASHGCAVVSPQSVKLEVEAGKSKGKSNKTQKDKNAFLRTEVEHQVKVAGEAATAAFAACPNLDVLVGALLEGGVELMTSRCAVTPGIPLKPMLAKIGCGIADAMGKLANKTSQAHSNLRLLAEYKYDGVRSMIHILRDEEGVAGGKESDERAVGSVVRIYSRNCEDKTNSFPDVVQMLQELVDGAQEMVLDAEIVAIDRNTHSLLPFQKLATRARVSASSVPEKQLRASEVSVSVCVFVFDLLFLNGHSLVNEALHERRRLLALALPPLAPAPAGKVAVMSGILEMARGVEISVPAPPGGWGAKNGGAKTGFAKEEEEDVEAEKVRVRAEQEDPLSCGQAALMEALEAQCEGLMIKDLSGHYVPGKRADSWLKVKKDYVEGLADSLDLVPIGAWHGAGRKAGWFSPFLLAVHDPETGELQSVCRCMSGFTDEFYKAATERLGARVVGAPPSYYVTGERPSVWFVAEEVWEIRGAELSISPVHMAANGKVGTGGRGLALRFPRFLALRGDKSIDDASTPDDVLSLFDKQANRAAAPSRPAQASSATPQEHCLPDNDAALASDQDSGLDDEADGAP